MNYTLYIGSAADDKCSAYSWILVNHTGVVMSDIYLTGGERRFDENYCGHVALQRALRRISQQEGVIQLRVSLDDALAEAIGFEICDVQKSLYPTLLRTTQRILKRFDKYDLASFRQDEADALPQEIAVVDDALNALEQAQTLVGKISYWRDYLMGSRKFIR